MQDIKKEHKNRQIIDFH